MARFESFCPQLCAGQIIPQGSKLVFEKSSQNHEQIVLPIETIEFLTRCDGSRTIRQIIEDMYQQHSPIHFGLFYRALLYLRDKGFLVNGHLLESDDLNNLYIRSFVDFRPLFQSFLGRRLLIDKTYPLAFYIVSLAIVVAAIITLPVVPWGRLTSIDISVSLRIEDFISIFVIGSSLLLSIKHIVKLILLLLLTGRAYNFSLVFSGFAFYLHVGSESTFMISNRLYLTLYHLALTLVYFPIVGAIFLSVPIDLFPAALWLLPVFLFLMDLDPFRPSEVHQYFCALSDDEMLARAMTYQKGGLGYSLAQTSLFWLYRLASVAWVVVVTLFIVGLLQSNGQNIVEVINEGEFWPAVGGLFFLVFLLSQLAIGLLNAFHLLVQSWVGPTFGSWVRRLRRKKSRPLTVHLTEDLANGLRELPILSHFSDESLEKLWTASQVLEFSAGSLVFRQGEISSNLGILLSGRLSLRRWEPMNRSRDLGEFLPLSLFGEMSLLVNGAQTDDVVADQDSVVCLIPEETLLQLADSPQARFEIENTRRIMMVHEFFYTAPLFRDMPQEVIDIFMTRGKIEDFATNEPIVREGSKGEGFYVIISGAVDVFVKGSFVNRIKQGSFFGEISLLADIPRTATIMATQPTMTLKIGADAFWEALSSNIALAIFIETTGKNRISRDLTVIDSRS